MVTYLRLHRPPQKGKRIQYRVCASHALDSLGKLQCGARSWRCLCQTAARRQNPGHARPCDQSWRCPCQTTARRVGSAKAGDPAQRGRRNPVGTMQQASKHSHNDCTKADPRCWFVKSMQFRWMRSMIRRNMPPALRALRTKRVHILPACPPSVAACVRRQELPPAVCPVASMQAAAP